MRMAINNCLRQDSQATLRECLDNVILDSVKTGGSSPALGSYNIYIYVDSHKEKGVYFNLVVT